MKKKKKKTQKIVPKKTNPIQQFFKSFYGNDSKVFLALLGLALIVRMLYFIHLSQNNPTVNLFIHDSAHFNHLARQVVDHGPILDRSFYISPLYIYFLAFFYKIGIESLLVIRLVQFLLGMLACGLTFLIGKRFFSRIAAAGAAVIQALYGPVLFFEGNLLATSLVLFFTLLAFYLLILCTEKRNVAFGILSGLSFALALIGRPNLLVVLPLPVLYLSLNQINKVTLTQRLKLISFWILGLCLPLLLTATHNYLADRYFTLITSHGGINFYIGNHRQAGGMWEAPEGIESNVAAINTEQAQQVAEEETGKKLSPAEVSDFWYRKAFRFIIAEPLQWFSLMLKKGLLFWSGYEIPLNFNYYFHQKYSFLLKIPVTQFYFILPLSLLGLIVGLSQWKTRWFIYGFILLYFLSVVIFFICGRYRLIVIPFVLLFAVHGIDWFFELIQKKKYSLFWGSFIALLIILFFSIINASDKIKRSNFGNEYYNIALAKIYQEEYQDSIYWGKLAAEADPQNADIHYNLGIAYLKLQKNDQAIEAFRRVLQINPQEVTALGNVGGLLLLQGKTHESIPILEKAAQLDPASINIHLNLGRAYYESGKYEKAIEKWKKVLEIDPNHQMARGNIKAVERLINQDL